MITGVILVTSYLVLIKIANYLIDRDYEKEYVAHEMYKYHRNRFQDEKEL